jgi:hypothetical protein
MVIPGSAPNCDPVAAPGKNEAVTVSSKVWEVTGVPEKRSRVSPVICWPATENVLVMEEFVKNELKAVVKV